MLIAAWASGLRPTAEMVELAAPSAASLAAEPDTVTPSKDAQSAEQAAPDKGSSSTSLDDDEATFLSPPLSGEDEEGEFCDGETCELDFGSEDEEESQELGDGSK